jgi:hypothetical protein
MFFFAEEIVRRIDLRLPQATLLTTNLVVASPFRTTGCRIMNQDSGDPGSKAKVKQERIDADEDGGSGPLTDHPLPLDSPTSSTNLGLARSGQAAGLPDSQTKRRSGESNSINEIKCILWLSWAQQQ